jgi:hypothetical protein
VSAVDDIGRDAALLSATEIGLGSMAHAWHVPLSGHLLSLNQILILTRFTRRWRAPAGVAAAPVGGPAAISAISACLKSLSPAGRKLTPMLAIAAQGACFNLGTVLLGRGRAGTLCGAGLASLWAFAQPVLIYALIFGAPLVRALGQLHAKTRAVVDVSPERLLAALGALVALKLVAAAAVVMAAWRLPESRWRGWDARLLAMGKARREAWVGARAAGNGGPGWAGAARAAARDLLNPLFLISLGLTGAFFWWSEQGPIAMAWMLLRPVAVGFILFFGVRVIRWEGVLRRMKRAGWQGPARACRVAVETLQGL